MQKATITILLILSCIQLYAWNRRHIIILQDNSGSFYAGYNESLISDIQSQVYDLFQNKKIGNDYSILNNEIEQGGLFYNPLTDKVSFYWFVADQLNNVRFYKSYHSTFKEFEDFFFKKGSVAYSDSIIIKDFLQENFKLRPELESCSNSFGISTYSFSAYAYPLCMDVIQDDYAEEYIVLIISDFNAGSTFGNRNDEKIIKDAFKSKANLVIQRVNELNSKLFKIDYFDYYRTTKYQGLIGFIGYKVRPSMGSRVPENVDLRINSNIELDQKSFRSNVYRLKDAEVVFEHNEKVSLNKAYVWIKMKDSDYTDIVDVTNHVIYNSNTKTYTFKGVDIRLGTKTEPSQNFNAEFKFLFYIDYKMGEEDYIKFVYDVGRNIDVSNIAFKTKLSNTQIATMIVLF